MQTYSRPFSHFVPKVRPYVKMHTLKKCLKGVCRAYQAPCEGDEGDAVHRGPRCLVVFRGPPLV